MRRCRPRRQPIAMARSIPARKSSPLPPPARNGGIDALDIKAVGHELFHAATNLIKCEMAHRQEPFGLLLLSQCTWLRARHEIELTKANNSARARALFDP